ncbi:DNA translocase FtsK [Bacillus sp. AK128]
MFKYFKGFYKLIVGEGTPQREEQQNPAKKKNIQQPPKSVSSEESDMNARVSYQYPKGNFRFPLISDDEVKNHIERRPKRVDKEVKSQAPVKRVPSKPNTKVTNKESFKATVVPSPVHGYQSQWKQSQDVIEFELPSTVQTQQQELVEEQFIDTDILEVDTIQSSMINTDPNTESINHVEAMIEEVKEETLYFVEEDKLDEDQVDIQNPYSAESEPILAVSDSAQSFQADEEVMGETAPLVQSTQSPKRYVPFNVVMLKEDREKLREKQPIHREVSEHQNRKIQDAELELTHTRYQFPPLHFLTMPKHDVNVDDQWLIEQQELLDLTLHNFNVRAKVVNVTQGPSVTRFEVHPEPGVKVNKITNLSDDIKLALSAKDIRMEAPIPGKNTIGIEVPNKKSKPVLLSEIISSQEFRGNPSPLTVALGLDISGKPIVTDLKKMPHGLIAGATGSGKSVCINAMLISLLYKASPSEVKLLLIDPKMVELAPYNEIPHLVSPVITDVKAATAALKWAVEEMERRYERFAHTGVRDISRYNELVREHNEPSGEMPFLVIIIDELADLMMVAPGEVEESICRIAQKARACGIHLLLATQRPSVDVITGLIKANIPTRIAFSVSSQVDSRTIIDSIGADKLLGKGDMLFLENGSSKPYRLQGNFVSDQEIEKAVSFVKSQQKPEYLFEQEELISRSAVFTQEEDELFLEACEFVIEQGGASSSSLQRRFRIGYNRAARLIEMMEDQGFISEQRGSKPRDVLITEDQLIEKQQHN